MLLYSWFNREKMRYEPLQKDLRYTVTTAHWLLDVRRAAAPSRRVHSCMLCGGVVSTVGGRD